MQPSPVRFGEVVAVAALAHEGMLGAGGHKPKSLARDVTLRDFIRLNLLSEESTRGLVPASAGAWAEPSVHAELCPRLPVATGAVGARTSGEAARCATDSCGAEAGVHPCRTGGQCFLYGLGSPLLAATSPQCETAAPKPHALSPCQKTRRQGSADLRAPHAASGSLCVVGGAAPRQARRWGT